MAVKYYIKVSDHEDDLLWLGRSSVGGKFALYQDKENALAITSKRVFEEWVLYLQNKYLYMQVFKEKS